MKHTATVLCVIWALVIAAYPTATVAVIGFVVVAVAMLSSDLITGHRDRRHPHA